jgi:hypothetical protein
VIASSFIVLELEPVFGIVTSRSAIFCALAFLNFAGFWSLFSDVKRDLTFQFSVFRVRVSDFRTEGRGIENGHSGKLYCRRIAVRLYVQRGPHILAQRYPVDLTVVRRSLRAEQHSMPIEATRTQSRSKYVFSIPSTTTRKTHDTRNPLFE